MTSRNGVIVVAFKWRAFCLRFLWLPHFDLYFFVTLLTAYLNNRSLNLYYYLHFFKILSHFYPHHTAYLLFFTEYKTYIFEDIIYPKSKHGCRPYRVDYTRTTDVLFNLKTTLTLVGISIVAVVSTLMSFRLCITIKYLLLIFRYSVRTCIN